jgi:putative nucleotidyltransferase with HDIG domain
MISEEAVKNAFPSIDQIDDQILQKKVIHVWVQALEENEYESISDLRLHPPLEDEIGDVRQLRHAREVNNIAISIADTVSELLDGGINRNMVIAGAVLHDVTKPYELNLKEKTDLGKYVPHPHYCVHLLSQFDIPLELQHIVLAHSRYSAVEPMTIEAKIVQMADEMGAEVLWWEKNETLSDI